MTRVLGPSAGASVAMVFLTAPLHGEGPQVVPLGPDTSAAISIDGDVWIAAGSVLYEVLEESPDGVENRHIARPFATPHEAGIAHVYLSRATGNLITIGADARGIASFDTHQKTFTWSTTLPEPAPAVIFGHAEAIEAGIIGLSAGTEAGHDNQRYVILVDSADGSILEQVPVDDYYLNPNRYDPRFALSSDATSMVVGHGSTHYRRLDRQNGESWTTELFNFRYEDSWSSGEQKFQSGIGAIGFDGDEVQFVAIYADGCGVSWQPYGFPYNVYYRYYVILHTRTAVFRHAVPTKEVGTSSPVAYSTILFSGESPSVTCDDIERESMASYLGDWASGSFSPSGQWVVGPSARNLQDARQVSPLDFRNVLAGPDTPEYAFDLNEELLLHWEDDSWLLVHTNLVVDNLLLRVAELEPKVTATDTIAHLLGHGGSLPVAMYDKNNDSVIDAADVVTE